MKVNEHLSILFWLKRSKATKDGMSPIYARITVDGDRDGFASGKKINPLFWDEETGASPSCPDQKAINSYINKTKVALEKCYNLLEATEPMVTAAMVKDRYVPKKEVKKSLLEAFKLHNTEFSERVILNLLKFWRVSLNMREKTMKRAG